MSKNAGGKKSKRPRKPKVSKGIHGGGGKVTLTALQKVLLGGGLLAVPIRRRVREEEK